MMLFPQESAIISQLGIHQPANDRHCGDQAVGYSSLWLEDYQEMDKIRQNTKSGLYSLEIIDDYLSGICHPFPVQCASGVC